MNIQHIFRLSVLLMMILATAFVAQAQPEDEPPLPREKLEALRIAFFSERLNLNPQEAQVFWPVYNSYSAEMSKIHDERRRMMEDLRTNALVKSEKELEQTADNHILLMEKEVGIQKKYHSKFKEVLPIAKVLQFYRAEKDFPRWLLKQVRDRRNEGGGGRWQRNE